MSDVDIKYKNQVIASMDASGTKTLETDGTYCEDDIVVEYTKPSGADVSGVTATAGDVRHGKVIVGADGSPITGNGYMGFAFGSAAASSGNTLGVPHLGRTMIYADHEPVYEANEIVFAYYETGMTNGIIHMGLYGGTITRPYECPVTISGSNITFDVTNVAGRFGSTNGNQYYFVTSEVFNPSAQ